MVKLLGEKAINKLKDAEEGQLSNQQTVWGLTIDADLEKMSLPGAYLLAQSHFNYGNKNLPLKELQRFRGIANGWSAVIAGLRNELRAAEAPSAPTQRAGKWQSSPSTWASTWTMRFSMWRSLKGGRR